MCFDFYKLFRVLVILLVWSNDFVNAARDECYTAAIIVGTLFVSFLIALLVFGMLYLAYIKPRYEQYRRDVAECRAKHEFYDQAAALPEPDAECRPDQGSYYSTNANTPFVFTLHPPTPAMTTEYIYSQGRLSPYRAAYHEALSTARRITTPREQCSRRYSKETAISGVTVDENFPVDAHRMTHRYPYGSSRVNEEDLRNARRLSSILAARSTTTTGRMHSLDPIGTRV